MLINEILLRSYIKVWDWSFPELDGLIPAQRSRSGLNICLFGVFLSEFLIQVHGSQQNDSPCLDEGGIKPPENILSLLYPLLNNSGPKFDLPAWKLLRSDTEQPPDPMYLLLF